MLSIWKSTLFYKCNSCRYRHEKKNKKNFISSKIWFCILLNQFTANILLFLNILKKKKKISPLSLLHTPWWCRHRHPRTFFFFSSQFTLDFQILEDNPSSLNFLSRNIWIHIHTETYDLLIHFLWFFFIPLPSLI